MIVAAVAAGAGCWTWTKPGAPDRGTEPPVATLLVLDNGFHTDIALPRAALIEGTGPLAEAARALPPGDWVRIGWGDAVFYVDQTPIADRIPDGARAFFMPGNRSVVMLDPVQSDPATSTGEEAHVAVPLSASALASLRARVEGAMFLKDGRAVIAAQRPGDDARFYASTETFWVGHLCNHWTAGLLNAAGIPIQPVRAITSGGVMKAAELDFSAPHA
ncbi:hypothetical protein ASG17_02095 [Brevundimonas sp. Leaf363]|nr:hypothetical protein ASG17_02095 [Brevundimonas sp. Leaf363]